MTDTIQFKGTNESPFQMPIAEQIWDMKYRLKNPDGNPIDQTVQDTWYRIADAIADAEPEETQEHWSKVFYAALEDFKYLPAGRITAGAGTGRAVTLFNCFVMGTIPDSMDGIFSMLREAALTMQQGGGIGYDFSPIRPKTSLVKKLGSDASGPLSFMDCWDAMCRTVMSAGSRRGAMMATMRCDHPDIEDFITAKADATRLRMFNLSVLVTDQFMEAVRADDDWLLMHTEPPMQPVLGFETPVGGKHVHRVVKAKDLWESIMQSTYAHAEPGVIFIDRVNRDNNLNYLESIASTNPCGEQPLPPYGACLLGSINLAKFVSNPFTPSAGIDSVALSEIVHTAVRMMDNVIDVSNFPLPEQKLEAQNKRRIGLGVTGLADALAMCGLTYGTDEAARRVETWMRIVDEQAYRASVLLAKEKGPFPLFNADEYLRKGKHVGRFPQELQDQIAEHGLRNGLLTSIAPTGTISLYAGNVSSGIEPIFALSYDRKVLQPDGSRTTETVEDFAVAAYRDFWEQNVVEWVDDPDNGRSVPAEAFDAKKHLPEQFVTAQTLAPEAHVKMQAAAQLWVDSSISKTINCPEDISFEDFKAVYDMAYDSGCKGCTTYRPNEVTGSVLSVSEDKPEPSDGEGAGEGTTIATGATPSATAEKKCPDGGTCHHRCGKRCFRVSGASPLSGVYENDEWPDDVRMKHDRKFARDKRRADRKAHRPGTVAAKARPRVRVKVPQPRAVVPTKPVNVTIVNETGGGVALGKLVKVVKVDGAGTGDLTMELKDIVLNEADTDRLRDMTSSVTEAPAPRADVLPGETHKIKFGADEHAIYVTLTDIEENGQRRPFEIFINSKNMEHFAWTVALTRMISAVFRRPHDSRFVVEELKAVFDPKGGAWMDGKYVPSVLAAIGNVIEHHMKSIGYMEPSDRLDEAPAPKESPTEVPAFQSRRVGATCQKCGSTNLKNESGCEQCLDCGHSKCG